MESIPAYFLPHILSPVLCALGNSTSRWSAPLIIPFSILLRLLIPGFAVRAPYYLFWSSLPPNMTLTLPSLGCGTSCWTRVDLVKNLFLSFGKVDPPFAWSYFKLMACIPDSKKLNLKYIRKSAPMWVPAANQLVNQKMGPPLEISFFPRTNDLQRLMGLSLRVLQTVHSSLRVTFLVVFAFFLKMGLVWPPKPCCLAA